MLYKHALRFNMSNGDLRYAGHVFALTHIRWTDGGWNEVSISYPKAEYNAIIGPNGLEPIMQDINDLGVVLDLVIVYDRTVPYDILTVYGTRYAILENQLAVERDQALAKVMELRILLCDVDEALKRAHEVGLIPKSIIPRSLVDRMYRACHE